MMNPTAEEMEGRMSPMSGAEEVHSQEEERGCTQTGRVGRWPLRRFKKPIHRWLLKRKLANLKRKLANLHCKEYEAALKHCVDYYKYIYLFKYNDSSNFGFRIFEQVLWPSCRFLLQSCGHKMEALMKAFLGTSSEPVIHQLSTLAAHDDIGLCFSELPKWRLVREISNYEEHYIPHGAYYDRTTVIFRKGYLMAGDVKVVYNNLRRLQLEKHVNLERLEDGTKLPNGITREGVVHVSHNIVSRETNLKKSKYSGHHKEFLYHHMASTFRPTLLGCWNKDDGRLELYDETVWSSQL